MNTLTMRFHGNLNDFLPYARRERAFAVSVEGRPAVKDVIEAVGVPHPDVDMIVANDVSVDFRYIVRAGDLIEVFPVGVAVTLTPMRHLCLAPPAPRFVLDVHLGRLAAYLRLLGFDTRYANACDDDVLARIAHDEERILLTRDVGLLKRGAVIYGAFIRETQPERQAAEVMRRFRLLGAVRPFARCLSCNGLLAPAARTAVAGRVPERILTEFDRFQVCGACGKVFWPGSHYQRMQGLIARLRAEPTDDTATTPGG